MPNAISSHFHWEAVFGVNATQKIKGKVALIRSCELVVDIGVINVLLLRLEKNELSPRHVHAG